MVHSKRSLPLDKFHDVRTKELKAVQEAFSIHPHSKAAPVKVVFVSGESGVGKSTLLQKAVANIVDEITRRDDYAERCSIPLVGKAKFDRQSSPLDWIQSALAQMVDKIDLMMGDLERETLRKSLFTEMDLNHQSLLVSIFPATASLFGTVHDGKFRDETKVADDHAFRSPLLGDGGGGNKDTTIQLQLALKHFLRTLSRLRTLVIVLDDLQWCDIDSFGLLTSLLMDPVASNLVLTGTYRSNEETDQLRAFRDKLTSSPLCAESVHVIELGCFSREEVHQMMVGLLDENSEKTHELSQLIHQRTAGNIFFMRELLESLQRDDLIGYDWMTMKWKFDIHQVREHTAISENVLQVVVQKIRCLEIDAQALLQLCACLGSRISTDTLEICQSAFPEVSTLSKSLALLCEEKLLDDMGSSFFKFSHDKILESVELLLPTGNDREELHWRIGKLLWNSLRDGKGNKRLWFMCTDQINLGARSCMSDEEERLEVAKLNLSTARSSAALSAFRPACNFCKAGIEVLEDEIMHRVSAPKNSIMLDLFVQYAEMLYCVGRMRESKEYCCKVFASSSSDHKVPCYITMIRVLNAEAKIQEVIDFGLEALKELGEVVPKKPNMIGACLDYKKTSKLLKTSSDEDILSLPMMKDPLKAASLQIMQAMLMPMVHLAQNNLHTLILGRMLGITFKFGLTQWAPEAFAVAGVDIIARKDNIRDGYRLGRLAMAIVDQLQTKSVQAKVCGWTSSSTSCWVEPLPKCLDIAITGYESGMLYGDTHFAFHNINCYALDYFYGGLPLGPLLSDLEKYCQQMIDYGQHMSLLNTIPCWQCVLNLCGKQPLDPLNMTTGFALDKQNVANNEKKIGEQACWSFLLQLCYYLEEFDRAADLSQRLQGLTLGITRAVVFYPTRVFFFALSAIERFGSTSKRKFKQEAKEHLDQILKWVQAGAINLVHKSMLLRAEMESLQAKQDFEKTRSLYDKAFSMAKRTGFLQDAALSSQLAALFCFKHKPELAADYLIKAWEQWMAWGAVVVAERLESKFPNVFGNSGAQRSAVLDYSSSSSLHSRRRFNESSAKRHEDVE